MSVFDYLPNYYSKLKFSSHTCRVMSPLTSPFPLSPEKRRPTDPSSCSSSPRRPRGRSCSASTASGTAAAAHSRAGCSRRRCPSASRSRRPAAAAEAEEGSPRRPTVRSCLLKMRSHLIIMAGKKSSYKYPGVISSDRCGAFLKQFGRFGCSFPETD